MDLYEMILSPVCGRVRFAMDVKSLQYTSHIHTPGLTDGKISKIAPKVMVPTLVDGRAVIQGSDEILEHLERKKPSPNLLGNNPDEAKAINRYVDVFRELMPQLRTDTVVRSRKNIADYSKESPLGALPGFIRVPIAKWALDKFSDKYSCEEGSVQVVRDRIEQTLRTLAPQLRPGQYLVGGRLTAADISIAELMLLFRPPSDNWHKIGPHTRRVYHAAWLDSEIAYPFEVWRDELYKANRNKR